jgi:hypothetical protein
MNTLGVGRLHFSKKIKEYMDGLKSKVQLHDINKMFST